MPLRISPAFEFATWVRTFILHEWAVDKDILHFSDNIVNESLQSIPSIYLSHLLEEEDVPSVIFPEVGPKKEEHSLQRNLGLPWADPFLTKFDEPHLGQIIEELLFLKLLLVLFRAALPSPLGESPFSSISSFTTSITCSLSSTSSSELINCW